jgi:hypothetical protein
MVSCENSPLKMKTPARQRSAFFIPAMLFG